MSRQDKMQRIAEAAGVSVSTVYRALLNCGNVDPRTKARILEAAGALDNEEALPDTQPLGVLLRSSPRYFWGAALEAINRAAAASDIPLAEALCRDFETDTDFLYCLNTLRKRHTGVYITAPGSKGEHTQTAKQLAELAVLFPVIFLCERYNTPGSYYVGSDPADDGRRFADAVTPLTPDNARILVIGCGNRPVADTRCDAFLSQLTANMPGARKIGRIDMDFEHRSAPAQLARRIDEQFHNAFNTVFVSQGVLPQVASALYKMRLHGKVRCFGCENPPANIPFIENGTIHAVLEQDIVGQATRAVELAAALRGGRDAPHTHHIPSHIHIFPQT